PRLLGTGYTAALYGGPLGANADQLVLLATSMFYLSPPALAGFIQPLALAPTVPGVTAGERATFELRVWNNLGGTVNSWAAVLASDCAERGTSGLFSPPDPLTVPPTLPINLVGLTSFNLHILGGGLPACVPEPAVGMFALVAVGL